MQRKTQKVIQFHVTSVFLTGKRSTVIETSEDTIFAKK